MRIGPIGAVAGLLLVALLTVAAKDSADKGPPPAGGLQEAEVAGVALDPQTRQPFVVLQGKRDKRNLVMAIGPFEGNAIAIPLQGVTPPRPLTHDLILTLLADLKASLRRIVITDLRDDVFYALLVLDAQGRELRVDSRPSDAIALALRARVPILVEERVFEKAERLAPRPGPSPHI
jgi:bifunctional DNase/RNase